MVTSLLQRRQFLAALCTASLMPRLAQADDYRELDWIDLLPVGQAPLPPVIQELLKHDENAMAGRQSASSGVRSDWNGAFVRLPGFVVPIDYSGSGVTAFILVPFVGACVHVPPPPANQLVFVTTDTLYESQGLYEPVNVSGRFSTTSLMTELAAVGYALSADRIERFGG